MQVYLQPAVDAGRVEIRELALAVPEGAISVLLALEREGRDVVLRVGGLGGLERIQSPGSESGAAFLAQLAGLKLVWLDACATNEQAEALHAAGVIVTESGINGELARIFASRFYKSLLSGSTLAEAYDDATQEAQLHARYSRGRPYDGWRWSLHTTTPEDGAWKLPIRAAGQA